MESRRYIDEYADRLPENLTAAFEELDKIRSVDKNTVIYRQGDDAHCFYYIKKGRVRIYITSENGIEKTLSVAGKGSIIGEAAFFDARPRISSAKSIVKSELVSITKEILVEIIKKNPYTAMELFRLQAETIRMLSMQVDSITFMSASARIAGLLLQSSSTTHDGAVYATHEEIGSIVGVSRVTVSKIMADYSAEGIIKTGYRCIHVLDIARLENKTKC